MGYAARVAVSLLLVVVVLKGSVGAREAIGSYELILLYLAFGICAIAAYAWRGGVSSVLGGDSELRAVGPVLLKLVGATVVTVALVAVMATLDGPGFAETDRSLTFGGIFLLVVAYPVFHHRLERLIRRNWPYLLAFAALFGVYANHGANGAAGSALAAFPLAVGFILVVNLFVLPRYVPVWDFLWAASWIAAAVVLLGLAAYVVGEYTVVSLPVALWDATFSPWLVPIEVNPLQSVFGNPNTMGILAFVGTLGALVGLHRVAERVAGGDGSEVSGSGVSSVEVAARLALPAALLVVNGLGLYLTHSRASMLAAGTGGFVYLAYVGLGREVVPRAVAGTLVLLVLALAAVGSGLLGVSSGNRFLLWRAGVEALLASPTPLGEGISETGAIIEPYVTDPDRRGTGVHNSYLATALRAGLVGGAAYVLLVVGSLVHALSVDRAVPVAPVALAVGFAVHQLFESYTLFQHSLGAVLASLAVGYVIAAIRETGPVAPRTSGMADVYDRRDERRLSG